MRFGAAQVVGLLATASTVLGAPQVLGKRSIAPIDISKVFDDDLSLFEGSLADTGLGSPEVELELKAKKGSKIQGSVGVSVNIDDITNPILELDVSGIEILLDHKVKAGAKANLAFPFLEHVIEDALDLKDFDIDVLLALELVISFDSAIELDSCGVYVKLGKNSVIKIELFSGEIVHKSLNDIIARGLPAEALSGGGVIASSLRLRSKVRTRAVVDIPIKPDLGINTELDVYVAIADYNAVFIATPQCALQITEKTSVTIGIAFAVDIDIGPIKDISIVPKTLFTLVDTEAKSFCLGYKPLPPKHTKTAKPTGPKPTGKPDHDDGTTTITKTRTNTYTITACGEDKPNCGKPHQTKHVITKTLTDYEYVCPTETVYTSTRKPQPPTDCETLTPPKETNPPKPPKPCRKYQCGDDSDSSDDEGHGGYKPPHGDKPDYPVGDKPEKPEGGNKPTAPKPTGSHNGTKPDSGNKAKVNAAQPVVANIMAVGLALAGAVFLF